MSTGSMISMGFDELGEHGMIVGEIKKEGNYIEFIKLDDTEFDEYEFDVSNIFSEEELIEKINNKKWEKNKLLKIILIGKRNFEININNIIKLINIENIIKIKNKTKNEMNLKKLAKKINYKALFIKELMKKLESANDDEKEKIKNAIEVGIEVLEK